MVRKSGGGEVLAMSESTAEHSEIFEGEMPVYVIGIDIKNYSTREEHITISLQEKFDRILANSISKAKKKRKIYDSYWIDGGDGGFLLINSKSIRAVIDIIKDCEAEVQNDNKGAIPEHQFTLRYALHAGQIIGWAGSLAHQRFAGAAITVCARILDSMDRTQEGQVVVSEVFRIKYVKFNTNDRCFSEIDPVVDKHGNVHKIWNFHLGVELGVDPNALKGGFINPQ